MSDSLKKLYIEPSSVCNLKCKMCFRNTWFDEKQEIMSKALCKKITKDAEELNELESVVFGGMGEPLVSSDIFNMIKVFSEKGIITELITNATLLNKKISTELIKSGLTRLWVSMDGFSKEAYESIRMGSQFDLICSNLEKFNSVRQGSDTKLGITFVMMKENVNFIDCINDFADKYDADMINLSHAIPSEPISKEEVLYFDNYPVGRMHRYPIAEPKEEYVCPFVDSGSMFIRSDGDSAPCMQLLHNSYTYLYEERRKVERQSYGNVKHKSIKEIFENEEYKAFRERVRTFHFSNCTGCTTGCFMRETNLEDCMCNTKPTCGACLWSLGIIFCP